ncbi:hypothetical protein WOLCODRAFT_140358 [Wolfiporia cocos MD-104 SS10]|uniref:Clc chloride channel n=1 Tax=Wolfiporia cocos (strain MD-104) TaxID=742152 RepID=A0A2H3J2Z7_WOLCO|nr:hypothetical protein WOLCODRAFT_140358 [Wolfiporia cocos MD-104 SS10]
MLRDLREGRCAYGFFYNQVACCSEIEPGGDCTQWQTWSECLHIRFIFVQSLLQSSIYVALAFALVGSAAVLVKAYAPYAFHTGIPEIKAILNGYVLDAFLSPWTLLIKALGLALAVASGLSLGKEGPLVHVSCCLAFLLSKMFKHIHRNEARKRKMLAAAAVAGVSVAFGSPLGGVLFGLEEFDTFASGTDVMWRGFVTSVIAAMALQYVGPFSPSKLVLFQVTEATTVWRRFELIPWLFLAVLGGLLGSLLIKMNAAAAVYRHNSILRSLPTLEVIGFSAITAAVSYLVVFLRVQSMDLVANLFQECDPTDVDFHGLCNYMGECLPTGLDCHYQDRFDRLDVRHDGRSLPVFLAKIAIGACFGRAVGLITQGLHRTFPTAWIFNSCPPDPTVRCVSPRFYAVIGVAAMLGGVTRVTTHRGALARPPNHDHRHGLQMGGRLLRQGRHLHRLDCDARVPLATACRVPRQGRDGRGSDQARREPRRSRARLERHYVEGSQAVCGYVPLPRIPGAARGPVAGVCHKR